ncbi:uncharacterized protein PHACADRAFT_266169 [Phanerochaete carnosa HHB-10118-sp]|uniref:Uncharacterized protein n=1 Tax=Phanerochaete carnosa (strain HHB-10118-sp) TaxID=650164 RepID=K5UGY9_PHACS|nr:uncharacterized protein PHACADRAFT_266169 [Phanerochaete carnosa HHB-10118-sp]EKM48746.1 hypothetical protein PHACADRAFT_266169 [Phanerochaete carnosa HHB-10118-sp]
MLDPTQLADKLYYYITQHQVAADVICSDLIRRDRALNTVDQTASLGIPGVTPLFGPTRTVSNEEVDGIIAQYDRMLAHEPRTYKDFFHRLQYAAAAAMFFLLHKVTPAVSHDRSCFKQYSTQMAKLHWIFHAHRAAMFAIPTSGLINRPQAISLLGNIHQLLARRFIIHASNPRQAWKITTCKHTADSILYGATFEDTAMELTEEELVDTMVQSQLVN